MVEAIHQTLYDPDQWATFASGDFYNFYQGIVQVSGSDLTLATRSEWAPPMLKRQSGQFWQDYTFQAITCGDSIDQSDITTQAVFDELVRAVNNVSSMCKWLRSFFFPSAFLLAMSSWHPIPPALPFLPQMARSCRRKVRRSVE